MTATLWAADPNDLADPTTLFWDADTTQHLVTIPEEGTVPSELPPNTMIVYRCDISTAAAPPFPFFSSLSGNDSPPTWTFGPSMLQMFGTILISATPALYDLTAQDQYGYSGAGRYRTYAQVQDINTGQVTAEYTVQEGLLLIQFARAPQPGQIDFSGQPNYGCGCCPPWDTSAGAPDTPAPSGDAVLVYGDQQIAGQKDFTEIPTVDGVPLTDVASQWFTGTGRPSDPYPGANVNDYYLDVSTGDVWQLGDTSSWSVTAHQAETAQNQGYASMVPGTATAGTAQEESNG